MNILYVEIPGFAALPSRDVMKIVSHGAHIQSVSDESAAITVLKTRPINVLVCNAPTLKLFDIARDFNPDLSRILVTDLPMDQYSQKLAGREELLLDHIIALRADSEWTTHDLRITLQKIISNDIFGAEKYLAAGADVHKVPILTSGDREQYNNEAMHFAEECRLGTHISKAVWGIAEEMLMNAIYDAPAAAGIEKFRNMPRTAKINLDASERPTLIYGCDGEVFVVGIIDPFGLLTQGKLFEYLKKVLRRADSSSIIDSKEGGAGLGLFKILYSCHGLVCNVEKGVRTEVLALIDTTEQLRDFARMTRSIHFFDKH